MKRFFVVGQTVVHPAVMIRGRIRTPCGQILDPVNPRVYTAAEAREERIEPTCARCPDCREPKERRR